MLTSNAGIQTNVQTCMPTMLAYSEYNVRIICNVDFVHIHMFVVSNCTVFVASISSKHIYIWQTKQIEYSVSSYKGT